MLRKQNFSIWDGNSASVKLLSFLQEQLDRGQFQQRVLDFCNMQRMFSVRAHDWCSPAQCRVSPRKLKADSHALLLPVFIYLPMSTKNIFDITDSWTLFFFVVVAVLNSILFQGFCPCQHWEWTSHKQYLLQVCYIWLCWIVVLLLWCFFMLRNHAASWSARNDSFGYLFFC